jgi:hypothetical protein
LYELVDVLVIVLPKESIRNPSVGSFATAMATIVIKRSDDLKLFGWTIDYSS